VGFQQVDSHRISFLTVWSITSPCASDCLAKRWKRFHGSAVLGWLDLVGRETAFIRQHLTRLEYFAILKTRLSGMFGLDAEYRFWLILIASGN
jgi:hypothetical protein